MKKLLLAITLVLCIALCLALASCGESESGENDSLPNDSKQSGENNSSNAGEQGDGENDTNDDPYKTVEIELLYTLSKDGKSYTITGCKLPDSGGIIDGNLVIPNEHNGLPVTEIASGAFAGISYISRVTISNGITSIGSAAFSFCQSLYKVVIPNSVKNIGKAAFAYCDSLDYNRYDTALYLGNTENPYLLLVNVVSNDIRNCEINANTKFIDPFAFYYCNELIYNNYGGGMYLGNKDNPYMALMYASTTDTCCVNENTKSINCEAIRCLEIGVIEGNQMYASLEGVLYSKDGKTLLRYPSVRDEEGFSIPDGVTAIGDFAFYECKLSEIAIPSSVTSIGSNAFSGCNRLEAVCVSNMESWCNISFDDNPSWYADNLYLNGELVTELEIPNGVTDFRGAFVNFEGLISVKIPNSVTIVDAGAFVGCKNLECIIVEDGNKLYKTLDGVLYSKDGTTLVMYPSGKKNSEFATPKGVTTICEYAFV